MPPWISAAAAPPWAPSRALPLRGVEIAFVLVALLLYSNALVGPLFAPDQVTADDVAWLRLLWLPVYAGTALFCVVRFRALLPPNPAWVLFGVVIGWVALSSNWSIDPETTTRRSIGLVGTTLFGIYFASSFRRGEFVTIIAKCLIALGIGSIFTALFYPKMGIHHDLLAGDWRGLWYHKNAMGAMMAYGVFSCVSAMLITGRWKGWMMGALVCFALVLMSKSKTALMCTLLPFAIYPVIWAIRRGPATATATIFAVGTAALGLFGLLWCAPDAVLQALGKDPTLTGRTDIWAALDRQLALHPLLGFGYGAFWLKDSTPAKFIRAQTHWLVPSAHNGWLDVLVQVGWIGGVLVGLLVAVAVVAAVVRGWRTDDGCWSLFLVSTFLLHSISESVLISENSFDWAMFAVALTTLLDQARAPRSQAARAPVGAWVQPAA